MVWKTQDTSRHRYAKGNKAHVEMRLMHSGRIVRRRACSLSATPHTRKGPCTNTEIRTHLSQNATPA